MHRCSIAGSLGRPIPSFLFFFFFLVLLNILFYFYCIFLFSKLFSSFTFQMLPPSSYSIPEFFTPYPLYFGSENVLPPTPLSHPQKYSNIPLSWGYQVSTGLGSSFPTEASQGCPLAQICQRPRFCEEMLD